MKIFYASPGSLVNTSAMNRMDGTSTVSPTTGAHYDRNKFVDSMQSYSESVTAFSWLVSGPSGYFVVEPPKAASEPTL